MRSFIVSSSRPNATPATLEDDFATLVSIVSPHFETVADVKKALRPGYDESNVSLLKVTVEVIPFHDA